MRITAELLRERGATCSQVDVFAREWPKGADVTVKNCHRAAALGLDLYWAGQNLLPPNGRRVFQNAAVKPGMVYLAATEEPWMAYKTALDGGDLSKDALSEAKKTFHRAVNGPWRVYTNALADCFFAACRRCEEKPEKEGQRNE